MHHRIFVKSGNLALAGNTGLPICTEFTRARFAFNQLHTTNTYLKRINIYFRPV